MFGRAAIRLGIGPHSSLYFIKRVDDIKLIICSYNVLVSVLFLQKFVNS